MKRYYSPHKRSKNKHTLRNKDISKHHGTIFNKVVYNTIANVENKITQNSGSKTFIYRGALAEEAPRTYSGTAV